MNTFSQSFCRHIHVLLLLWPACYCCTCLNQQPPIIQVCRNKNCCKQAPQLLETVSDLFDTNAATVTSSGCLSHCETGPTARIELPGQPLVFLHELNDAATVIAQLEVECAITIPKLLGAAAKLMERVQSTQDPAEQERLLSSVISKLAAEGSEHTQSTALAHAYSLRARAFCDQQQWSLAIEDAQKVVLGGDLRFLAATDSSLSLSYRVWADAEEQLGIIEEKEEDGVHSKDRVIAVLQRWQKAQPSYRTKLQREMEEMLEK